MIHSVTNYQNNDFIKQHTCNLKSMSQQLCQSKKIQILSYNRQYDDGTTLALCTHEQWFDNYFAKYKMGHYVYGRLSPGVNYWDRTNDDFLQQVKEDAEKNFDIAGVIECVYRDSTKNCYHLYAFYTDTKNANKICTFYQKHKAEILRILSNLNSHGFENLHGEDEKAARFQHVGYHLPKGYLQYYKQCKALLYEKNYYKLSDHEVEILILYGVGGFTANQIAEMLCKSPKTIEYHISQIRNRTELKDRRAMSAYAREKGWDKLMHYFHSLSAIVDNSVLSLSKA